MAQFTWSASRLLKYLECPYAYFLKFIKKASMPIPWYFVFGKAIHKGIWICHKGNPHQKKFTPTTERPLFFRDAQALGGFWIKLWEREIKKAEEETGIRWKEGESENKQKDLLKNLGWVMLAGTKDGRWRGYYNSILHPPFPIEILESEFFFRADLFGRFRVTAKIDQIWKTPEGTAIVDFTTGRSSNVKFLQMTFYHLALEAYCQNSLTAQERFGCNAKRHYVWNLREEELIPTSPQNSAKLQEILEYATTGVHLGEFHETQQDDICHSCQFQEVCEKTTGEGIPLKRESGGKLEISLPKRKEKPKHKQLFFKKGLPGGWRQGTKVKK